MGSPRGLTGTSKTATGAHPALAIKQVSRPCDLQDLELDVPDAETLLALFLARSIVDEALPPSALTALAKSLPSGCPALDVVQLTGGP